MRLGRAEGPFTADLGSGVFFLLDENAGAQADVLRLLDSLTGNKNKRHLRTTIFFFGTPYPSWASG